MLLRTNTARSARREAQKLLNASRSDKRPEVRVQAKLAQQRQAQHVEVAPPEIAPPAAPTSVSLTGGDLTSFDLSLIKHPPSSLTELDLSHNLLTDVPGLKSLSNLISLNLCRNNLRILPTSICALTKLGVLNVSRNELRPNADFLILLTEPPLPSLQTLDLTFNKKIFTQSILDLLNTALPSVNVSVTVTSPPPVGAYVGASAAERDASLLRSQLEPFTTLQLRQRLIETFGKPPYGIHGEAPPSRADVMVELLSEYSKHGERELVRVKGKLLDDKVVEKVLSELELWSERNDKFQERPMIKAEQYMILRSPSEVEEKLIRLGSRRARGAKHKYMENQSLWNAAKAAMVTVDTEFAETFTGLAVTKSFIGSPHIDTTNIGPFYGLSVGDFEDGTGGVRVELDPMTVCEVRFCVGRSRMYRHNF